MSLRTASPSRPDGVYRTRGALWTRALASALGVGVVVLAVVPGKTQVAGFVFVGPVSYLAWRSWLFGIRLRDDGIVVGGFLSSCRVSWSDIERFTVEPAGPYPSVGHVIRTDGARPLIVSGIDAGRRPTNESRMDAQAVVDLLDAQLAQRQLDRP